MERINHLEYYELDKFTKRWLCKRGGRVLDGVFDKFIARYIVIASIANALKRADDRMEGGHDKQYCTEKIAELFNGSEEMITCKLNRHAKELGKVISDRPFSVISSRGYNPDLHGKWGDETECKGEWLKSLLETLYYLRCNLFHGHKEFEPYQQELLSPANNCLRIIIKEAMNALKPDLQ